MSEHDKPRYLDKINDRRQAVVTKVIQDMQEEGLAWTAPFTHTGRPYNPVSGTIYQGGNRLHLAFAGLEAGFTDPRWMTFKQAKDQGWHLQKGARSAIVEKWKEIPYFKEDEETGEKTIAGYYMRPVGYFNVFNAQQIDGIEPLENSEHLADATAPVSDLLTQSSRCPIQHGALGSGYGGYIPRRDTIIMAPRDTYRSDEAYMRVLLHEMTHSTGHETALARNLTGTFGTPDYAKEELVAELGAMFAASDLGVRADSVDDSFYRNHVAYLASWMRLLKDNPDHLFKAAAQADKATSLIVERYEHTRDTREQDREQERGSQPPSLTSKLDHAKHAAGHGRREGQDTRRENTNPER